MNRTRAIRWTVVVALTLLMSSRAVVAADYIVSTFDFDAEGWTYGFGVTGTAEFDPVVDATNDPNSGSLYCTANFANKPTEWQDCNFQRSLSLSLGGYAKIAYDVKVDPSSYLGTGSNYNGCTLVLREPWTEVGQVRLVGTNWIHVEQDLPANAPASVSIMNLRFYPSGGYFTNRMSYWVDNIKLLAATNPPPPPTLSAESSGPGLELIASAGAQYQRQNIRTLTPTYTWVSAGGPVTYAVTVAKPPPPGSAGFQLHLFLVGTSNSNPGSSPDYSEPNVVFLEVQQQGNGLYGGKVMFKTNAPNSNAMFYSPTGTVLALGDLPGNGTWSLTLNQAAVTLDAPGGATTNGLLPAEALPLFQNVFAYFGVQPNQLANLDKSATLARIQISGAGFASPIDQVFTTRESLDTNVWTIRAEDQTGIQPHPMNTVYRLSWGLPATGFELQATPALLPAAWAKPGLPVRSAGARRITFLPSNALPSPATGYFRLIQP